MHCKNQKLYHMITKNDKEKCKFHLKKDDESDFVFFFFLDKKSLNLRTIALMLLFFIRFVLVRVWLWEQEQSMRTYDIKPSSTRNRHLNTFVPLCMHARSEYTHKHSIRL